MTEKDRYEASGKAAADAAAFAAWQAIEAGLWDDHLTSLAGAIGRREALYDRKRPPKGSLPAGQVWAWMQGANPPRWEIRGTGALLDA